MARARSTCSTVRVARRALEIDAAQAARRSLSRVLRTASILKIEKREIKNDGGVLGKHLPRLAEEKMSANDVRTNEVANQLTSRPAPEWRIQLTCVAATATRLDGCWGRQSKHTQYDHHHSSPQTFTDNFEIPVHTNCSHSPTIRLYFSPAQSE